MVRVLTKAAEIPKRLPTDSVCGERRLLEVQRFGGLRSSQQYRDWKSELSHIHVRPPTKGGQDHLEAD